jgi:hypothetical protein
MQTPKPMKYITQAIICLDSDIQNDARARHAKRETAGDTELKLAIGDEPPRVVVKSQLFLNGSAIGALPQECRLTDSRLIIFGHGDENSKFIHGDHIGQWDAKQLAERIEIWLGGNDIKHISLQMCYSAGNRGGASQLDKWTVSASKSFAYELAKHCGYAETIGGVTAEHGLHSRREKDTGKWVSAFSTVEGRYKQKGDKVIFFPNANARPDKPIEPSETLYPPSSNKPRPW